MPPSGSINDHPLRIGAVNYLNTKPLVYGLAERLPEARLVFDLPSRLADALAADELDIALVPSVELAEHPEWSIVSDACISCRGPVLSVKLLFRVPPAEVRSLALDEGSRTSAVLAQILLSHLYDQRPQLMTLPIGQRHEQCNADAVLLIGDRAIRTNENDFAEVWDLGDRWCRWAELPFVFAMWVARPEIDTSMAESALSAARDQGYHHLHQIAEEQSQAMYLPSSLIEEYLSRNLNFYLGTKQRLGLDLFFRHAAQLGLVTDTPHIVNHDCPTKSA